MSSPAAPRRAWLLAEVGPGGARTGPLGRAPTDVRALRSAALLPPLQQPRRPPPLALRCAPLQVCPAPARAVPCVAWCREVHGAPRLFRSTVHLCQGPWYSR